MYIPKYIYVFKRIFLFVRPEYIILHIRHIRPCTGQTYYYYYYYRTYCVRIHTQYRTIIISVLGHAIQFLYEKLVIDYKVNERCNFVIQNIRETINIEYNLSNRHLGPGTLMKYTFRFMVPCIFVWFNFLE